MFLFSPSDGATRFTTFRRQTAAPLINKKRGRVTRLEIQIWAQNTSYTLAMFESLLGLDPVDYARYGALIVFFLLGGLSPEKTWLRADVAMSIGMGVGWLVFPQVLLGFQVSPGRWRTER